MADFGGWMMPIEYPAHSGGGVINEHSAVRERVGLFDVSHLGKVRIEGKGAREFLNHALTNDLAKIVPGQAQYSMLCDRHSGGVVDDLIVYLKSEQEILLIPNAANNSEVVRRLTSAAPESISIKNAHEEFAVFAIQGPLADQVLQNLGVKIDLDYMSFGEFSIAGEELIICRTGYTGERGYEVLPPWHVAEKVWRAILAEVEKSNGAVAGLGARDTLRTEMCYPLHGHELSMTISPVEASASWAVGWSKTSFWGDQVLRNQKEHGPSRILRPLTLNDRGIPRAEMKVVTEGNQDAGVVTSGTFSPTLKKGIALALVDPRLKIGDEVLIDIRGKLTRAIISKAPLVPSHVR